MVGDGIDALAKRRQCTKLVLPTQLMEGIHMKQDRLIAIDLAGLIETPTVLAID